MNTVTDPGLNTIKALNSSLELTRTPLPGSHKIYIAGERHPELRVPMRAISLSNGEVVSVYDTSGPYTDVSAAIDVKTGLPETLSLIHI